MKRFLFMTCILAFATTAQAQHTHEHAHHDQQGLHFVHPLVAESVSPDTKARVNYEYADPAGEHELEIEGEYAFSRAFSAEVGVHFNPAEGALGDTHVRLKGASYALEENQVLLGFGVSMNLPTGSEHEEEHEEEHGEEHEEMPDENHAVDEHGGFLAGPFVNAGIQTGRAEIVGWASLNISLEGEEADSLGAGHEESGRSSNLGYNLSALYHLTQKLEVMVELDGEMALASSEDHSFVANITPGAKVQPFANAPLAVGVGVSIPISTARAYDVRVLASAFYHF